MRKTIMQQMEDSRTSENMGKIIDLEPMYREDLLPEELSELDSWDRYGETTYSKDAGEMTFVVDIYLKK